MFQISIRAIRAISSISDRSFRSFRVKVAIDIPPCPHAKATTGFVRFHGVLIIAEHPLDHRTVDQPALGDGKSS
jgi:hypothetical protein